MVPSMHWTPRILLFSHKTSVLCHQFGGIQGKIRNAFARKQCSSQSHELLVKPWKPLNHQLEDTAPRFWNHSEDQHSTLAITSPDPVHSSPCHPEIHATAWTLKNYSYCGNKQGSTFPSASTQSRQRNWKSLPPPDNLDPDQVNGCTFWKQAVTALLRLLSKSSHIQQHCFTCIQCKLYFKSKLIITVGISEDTAGRDHLAGKQQDL